MRWLARHFPTLARLDAAKWIMLILTVAICWSIIWGLAQPFFLEEGECAMAYSTVC
jgi:hypothetical protein